MRGLFLKARTFWIAGQKLESRSASASCDVCDEGVSSVSSKEAILSEICLGAAILGALLPSLQRNLQLLP